MEDKGYICDIGLNLFCVLSFGKRSIGSNRNYILTCASPEIELEIFDSIRT